MNMSLFCVLRNNYIFQWIWWNITYPTNMSVRYTCLRFVSKLFYVLMHCSTSSARYDVQKRPLNIAKHATRELVLFRHAICCLASASVRQVVSCLIRYFLIYHYCDVMMGGIASQITSITIVYSTIYSDADQRKHQSPASLAFVRGIHWGPVNSPHKRPVTRKMSSFDNVIGF